MHFGYPVSTCYSPVLYTDDTRFLLHSCHFNKWLGYGAEAVEAMGELRLILIHILLTLAFVLTSCDDLGTAREVFGLLSEGRDGMTHEKEAGCSFGNKRVAGGECECKDALIGSLLMTVSLCVAKGLYCW